MKLAVDVNEVVLSNVGTTGEFKIRNSAKAFKILSDGLYSNKIRAIIRELSCNAVDSHTAAGTQNIPFEVHLPTMFEPWFSVRDFGTGLSGDQVVNIYTTYFESTKTDSNAFIGALGLGSKSPFSYTENFTVIAIKDGKKRIYSAFINDVGVPSIAEMSVEDTDEANGVEVKFSVTDRLDYQAFKNEASHVFSWFATPPKITGVSDFQIRSVEYAEKNIVPGVHSLPGSSRYNNVTSMALMGNIAYPLNNIPDPSKNLGSVAGLLDCGLVLECGIGELDFAASREQLSYVPLTISTIKRKLEELNANLAKHLAAKADAITNFWERAFYLYTEHHNKLYTAAVQKYVKDTKFPLYDTSGYYGQKTFELLSSDLEKRGFTITAFRANHGSTSRMSEASHYVKATPPNTGSVYVKYWAIPVEKSAIFILNDLKTGCATRARYHFNSKKLTGVVYCISHNDPDPVVRQQEYDKLMAELHNPPTIMKASELEKQTRTKSVSTQGICYIRLKSGQVEGYADSYTWEPYTQQLDENETYYYVALENRNAVTADGSASVPVFEIKARMDLCGISDIQKILILGVRKSRIKEIQEMDNFVWFEDKLKTEASKVNEDHVKVLVAAEILDNYYHKVYTNKKVATLVGPDSDYAKYVHTYKAAKLSGNVSSLVALCGKYSKVLNVDDIKKKVNKDKEALYKKYPLLKIVKENLDIKEEDVAEYIKLIDKQEKV